MQNFLDYTIPLPPIASQRRIADILDKADEIIRKRKEAIALTEQLQKSIFLDMFGDPVINPKGWEVVELGKLIIGKPNNGIFRKNDEYGGKIPVIWVKELFSGSILNTKNSISLDPTEQEIKKFGLKKGDILFCRSSLKLEGVGYNNVFDDEDDSALFECHIIRVSPNQSKINSIFLNYLLRTEGMRKVIISKSNTVTMSTIGQEQIKTIPVILPPKKNQDDFDKQLRYLIKLMAKKRFFLQESENLFNSLLQKAFKGEL
jgi:type I restriction enzyme S subunit